MIVSSALVISHGAMQLLANLAVNFLWASLHIVIHETGHVLAAWMVGSRIKQVGISKAGPFIRRTPARTPLRNVIVALAGPGLNLLTFVVFLAFGFSHAWIPLTLGLINLLPLPNSDFMKSISYLRHPVKGE